MCQGESAGAGADAPHSGGRRLFDQASITPAIGVVDCFKGKEQREVVPDEAREAKKESLDRI